MALVTNEQVVTQLEKERLLITLKETALALSRDHHTTSEELTKTIGSVLPSFSLSQEEALSLPIGVFASECTPLQAMVTFMHEKKRYAFKEIALLLNKSQRSISRAYRKGVVGLDLSEDFLIPLVKFSTGLSVLESVVYYLHRDCSLTFSKIASFLKKDQRTIWTIWHRAEEKLGGGSA